jgi:hypothetical protein
VHPGAARVGAGQAGDQSLAGEGDHPGVGRVGAATSGRAHGPRSLRARCSPAARKAGPGPAKAIPTSRPRSPGAAKTDTFLGQRYRQLVKRMPKAKALVALHRSILIIIFHLLADPTTEFTDLETGTNRGR